ncbi:hypothetical protein AWC38_SpisGene6440 [Stylophora pistillata]|uniref:HD domain-containing protein n=2 Tax=Stylophora pistillata TaxID=50429 RepID=A0A2B4SI66_STYPI|nr:hypothetical protein AWC38_SpisGene6440 [Stylophora pistillata]
MLAEKEGYSDEVVLGVFLHDIGHLIGFHKALPCMGDVGTEAHEIIGEQFLNDLGFPDSVTSFVRGHVDAKRYLVYKYPHYHEELSEASKLTLIYQGGPMKADEAEKFEELKHFEALIKMRKWDDLGKVKGAPIDSLDKYESMCKKFLETLCFK